MLLNQRFYFLIIDHTATFRKDVPLTPYYEKAFNLAQLGKLTEARENYGFAESLAKMSGNDLVVEVIQKDIEHFNLKF